MPSSRVLPRRRRTREGRATMNQTLVRTGLSALLLALALSLFVGGCSSGGDGTIDTTATTVAVVSMVPSPPELHPPTKRERASANRRALNPVLTNVWFIVARPSLVRRRRGRTLLEGIQRKAHRQSRRRLPDILTDESQAQ